MKRHRCIVCKKEKGTKGLSFHRFPKDVKQLHLWLRNLEKENCTPTSNSLVCSNHFEPECLQPIFNRVRLKKGSVPTVFTEQSHASIVHKPLLDENVIVEHEPEATLEIESSIETYSFYTEGMYASHIRASSVPYVFTEQSHASIVLDGNIIVKHEPEATPEVELSIQSHDSCTEIVGSEMHVHETNATSSTDATPCTGCRQQVQHDHQYTYTPMSYKKKLHDVQKRLREVCNTKRVLTQKVKRLQITVSTLRQVAVCCFFALEFSIVLSFPQESHCTVVFFTRMKRTRTQRSLVLMEHISSNNETYSEGAQQEIASVTTGQQAPENADIKSLHERLGRMEEEMKNIKSLLEELVRSSQQQQRVADKPACLPLSTLEEMDEFEAINDDGYMDVVRYFQYIGGFTLKEAVNACFKEALMDDITSSFTWLGNEEQRPLYNAKITMAIYEAVCHNQAFLKPTRAEFQEHMKVALRTAKERLRHKKKPRTQSFRMRRNFWNDGPAKEEPPEESTF